MYAFNDAVDRAVLKPVAEVYDAVMPGFISRGISNFFSNLDDLVVSFNDLLQLKGRQFLSDGLRFTINSTIGIYGLFDVASLVGLEKHNEDFGQTLGYWGVSSGPYLILPLLGPSTLRDGPALVVDAQVDPIYEFERQIDDQALYQAMAVRIIDTRAQLLGASSLLETAALDPYTFTREAWLSRRRSLVHDGNPPPEPAGADELDALDGAGLRGGDPLDELDRLDRMDELDRLERMDELDRLDAMDAPEDPDARDANAAPGEPRNDVGPGADPAPADAAPEPAAAPGEPAPAGTD